MSDISMPTEPPKPEPKKEWLDSVYVKFLLSLVAWAAPAPVAVVLLKLWYTHFSPVSERGNDPFTSIRHSITSFGAHTQDLILLAALLPSAVLLAIIYRKASSRVMALVLLVLAAAAEIVTLARMTGG